MAQTLVAIDWSPRLVRVALVDATLRASELVRLETFERSAEETVEEFVQRVREALPEELGTIVATVDAKKTSARLLSFPFADVRKVEAALLFELEGLLPYDLSELATSWRVAKKDADTTSVLACIAPRQAIAEELGELGAQELEPRSIVLPAVAAAELVPASEALEGVLVVDEEESHFALVQDGGIRYVRTIRHGGVDVDRALGAAFSVDAAQARTARQQEARWLPSEAAADADARRISDAVEAGAAGLVSQLLATFKALGEEHYPERIWLTGSGSRVAGFDALLSSRLSLEVGLVDLAAQLGEVEPKVEAIPPEHAVSLGLALASLRHGRNLPMNFRRGDLAYQGDLQVYRGQIIRAAVGVAAVLLFALMGAIVQYTVISTQERKIDRAFCDVTKRIVGEEICNPTKALAKMRQPGGSDGVILPEYSAADLFEMISKRLPKSVDVTFEDMEIRVDARPQEFDRATIKGEGGSFESIEQAAVELRKDPCVAEAEVERQRKSKSGKVEFSLNLKTRCPAGVAPGTTVAQGGPR